MAISDHALEGEVATGMTEDQAASALLKQWGATDEDASTDADDEADESNDEQADEAIDSEDDDSDEQADESGDIEIDVAGEKFKLPPAVAEQAKRIEAKAKEVEAGATRKFQEAADLRKAAELTATQATQQQHFNQAQTQLLGDHALVMRRMQLIEQMDMGALAESDPVQLTRINAEYNQLRTAKERIEGAYGRAQHLFGQDQQKVKEQRYQAAADFAKANIKDWATDGGKRLAAYAMGRGLAPADVENLLSQDPRLVLILDDAAYGARVRGAKPDQNKRVAAANKTLKPGAGGQSKTNATSNADKAKARLAKTGSVNDAALALLARSNAKRK